MRKKDPKLIFNFHLEDEEFEETVRTAVEAYAEDVIIKELDAKIQKIVENRIAKLVKADRWSPDGKINDMSFDNFIRIKTEKVIEDVIDKHIKDILAKKIAQIL